MWICELVALTQVIRQTASNVVWDFCSRKDQHLEMPSNPFIYRPSLQSLDSSLDWIQPEHALAGGESEIKQHENWSSDVWNYVCMSDFSQKQPEYLIKSEIGIAGKF